MDSSINKIIFKVKFIKIYIAWRVHGRYRFYHRVLTFEQISQNRSLGGRVGELRIVSNILVLQNTYIYIYIYKYKSLTDNHIEKTCYRKRERETKKSFIWRHTRKKEGYTDRETESETEKQRDKKRERREGREREREGKSESEREIYI